MLAWIKSNWGTIVALAVPAAPIGWWIARKSWAGVLWFLGFVQRVRQVEDGLSEHLEECAEARREMVSRQDRSDTKMDQIQSTLDKLVGAVEVLKDRL